TGTSSSLLSFEQRLDLAVRLAALMGDLHDEFFIVHRDLKPSNVIVQPMQSVVEQQQHQQQQQYQRHCIDLTLIDFGLARSIGQEG
ncbi:hypothetical protein NL529_30615, partial [Klebsiella pneumoniae]|nr:hypothetical protein [Klebsiella pneumoniae]